MLYFFLYVGSNNMGEYHISHRKAQAALFTKTPA